MQHTETTSENKSPWRFLGLNEMFTNLDSLLFTTILQMLFVFISVFLCVCLVSCI